MIRFSFKPTLLISLFLALPALAELEPVTLQLKWTHQFQFAGFYVAQEKGYYREVGLDVTFLEGGPSVDVSQIVLSGEADFGIGTSELLLDYVAGKPVRVLGVIYQHSPQVLIMQSDEPSDTLEDLLDSTLMMEKSSADLTAMLMHSGIDLNRLTFIDYSDHANQTHHYEDGAISAYLTDEPYTLDQQGIDYFIFSPRTYGIDFYGDNVFTTQHMVVNREETVNRFCAASVRGWKEALKNPEQAVDLILKNYPGEKSRDHLLYEARITQDLMTRLVKPGYMRLERWNHIADTYIEVGMLKTRPNLAEFMLLPDPPTHLPAWFWSAAPLTVSLLAFFVLVAAHFRNLTVRLKSEIILRKEREEQLRTAKDAAEDATRKKTWFIANVSHDLRAPISAMIGLGNIFQHHSNELNLPDKFNRFLDQLHSSGEFLMLLLTNILDLSVFEMDAATVHPEQHDLDEWCLNMSNMIQPLAEERGVQIQMQAHPAGCQIHIDITRLSQILLNLQHNAIKFSPQGGTVRTDVFHTPEQLKLIVQDQGPGIPADERASIFSPFHQGNTEPSNHSGIGLGLSIVQRNTQLLNGILRVDEVLPTGTKFTLEIPLK